MIIKSFAKQLMTEHFRQRTQAHNGTFDRYNK